MTTVSETLEQFDDYIFGRRSHSAGTARTYLTALNRFITLVGDIDISALDEEHIYQYKKAMTKNKCSSSYIATQLSAMSKYLEFLTKQYKITNVSETDLRLLRPRVQQKEVDPLEQYQLLDVLDAALHIEDKALVTILYYSGCRIDEIIKLYVDDIKFIEDPQAGDDEPVRLWNFIVNGKGNKERTVNLPGKAIPILNDYLTFIKLNGNKPEEESGKYKLFPKSYKTYWRRIHDVGKKAGIKLHPHKLRHTFGTVLRKNGVQLDSIAKLMGHSSLNTTRRYAKIADEETKQALKYL